MSANPLAPRTAGSGSWFGGSPVGDELGLASVPCDRRGSQGTQRQVVVYGPTVRIVQKSEESCGLVR